MLAAMLKKRLFSFWALTAWVSCRWSACELLLSACMDHILGYTDYGFSTWKPKHTRPVVLGWKVRSIRAITCWMSTSTSCKPVVFESMVECKTTRDYRWRHHLANGDINSWDQLLPSICSQCITFPAHKQMMNIMCVKTFTIGKLMLFAYKRTWMLTLKFVAAISCGQGWQSKG